MRRVFLAAFALCAAGQNAAAAELNEHQRHEVERVCERMQIAYTHATDANDAKGIYGIYAKDAVLINGKGRVEGADAIRDYFNKRVPERIASGITTRHVLTNILCEAVDETHAKSVSYETLYRYSNRDPKTIKSLSPVLLATITSTFVRTPEGWRYQTRNTVEVTPAP